MISVAGEDPLAQKRCPRCQKMLPVTAEFFHRNRHHATGFHDLCKVCRGAYRTASRAANPEAARQKERQYDAKTRDVRLARRKETWQRDPVQRARRLAENREWHRQHPGEATRRRDEWRAANPERLRKQLRDAYQRDPLRHRLSSQINASLRTSGASKGGRSILAILPYPIETLRKHLERQFTKEMSWENRGTYWEVDHILPLAGFKITSVDCDDFRAAWALTNLRPLPVIQNRSKGGKRTLLL